jgi:hypothetical protein
MPSGFAVAGLIIAGAVTVAWDVVLAYGLFALIKRVL